MLRHRSKQKKIQTIGVLCAVALMWSLGVSCGGSKETPTKSAEATPPAGSEGAVWKPTGNEGSVTGTASFKGTAPKPRAISMDADAVCASKHKETVYPETVVVNGNGTLRNVFVYVKTGLEGKSFAVPDQPVVLDQNGCMYKPHVLGIQARQNLKVVSSDNTTHNIHPLPQVNREWNVSQAPGADPILRSFARPEATIPVKCNQHPWMRAYIHVIDHPFYAVTGDDGSYKLDGLPPGDYEIEAVHEELGASTQKISVPPKGSAAANFDFNAKQAYHPSSLTTLPALVLACCSEMRKDAR
jgi:hypothetical protein